MSTQEKVMGNWNQFKGKVKQRWGQLTDDELQEVEGNIDQLIGLVQQKTGEARQQIERVIIKLNEDAGGAFTQATETARQYADQATEALRGAADQIPRARARRLRGSAGDVPPPAGGIGRRGVRHGPRRRLDRGTHCQLAQFASDREAGLVSTDQGTEREIKWHRIRFRTKEISRPARTRRRSPRDGPAQPRKNRNAITAHGAMAEQASDYMARGASRVREMTRDREGTAVAVALAAGLGVGLVVGTAVARSHRKQRSWRDRDDGRGIRAAADGQD